MVEAMTGPRNLGTRMDSIFNATFQSILGKYDTYLIGLGNAFDPHNCISGFRSRNIN